MGQRRGEPMHIIIQTIVRVTGVALITKRSVRRVEVLDTRDLGPENMPGTSQSRQSARRQYDKEFLRDCLQRRFY